MLGFEPVEMPVKMPVSHRPRSATIALVVLASVALLPTRGPATLLEDEPSVSLDSRWPCPDWGMYGRTLSRSFSTRCPSPINRSTAARLSPAWTFKTPRTVTASPAVVDGTVYVGAWDGVMYALDAATGGLRWTFQTEPAPGAAFGPIVSSAAVADVPTGGELRRLVVFGAGPRVYALDASEGSPVWTRYVGAVDAGGQPVLAEDPAEVESSPVIWDGTVYVGMDTHDLPDDETGGVRGGLLALDAATGRVRWKFEPDRGHGCGGVWSSPTLDVRRERLYVATANCKADPSAWTQHVEAVTAVDAGTGRPVWSFQPHEPNRNDWDFGATPNLFVDPAGRQVLGVGSKDGAYYALRPGDGKLLWRTQAAEPGDAGEDFSVGGFIGSPAVWEGRIYGGTAIGGPPYYHALDGRDGTVLWRGAAAPSYAASAVVNGVVFHGALDDALRAYEANTGRVLWSAPLLGPISSGPAVVDDSVYVGSGTSSSDACPSDTPVFSEACAVAFDDVLGSTGAVHAFRLALPGDTGGISSRLFSPQGNQLDLYRLDQEPPRWKPFIPSAANGGRDLNGQVCPLPGGRHILLGEDSGQAEGVPQGWGVFDLGSRRQVGKLIAEYGSTEQPEPYGCTIETGPSGGVQRIFATQVGTGSFESGDGQLIVFFASSPSLDATLGRSEEVCPQGDCSGLDARDSDWCVIDDDVRTAGGVALGSDGSVYVAESSPSGPAPGRVLRYAPPFPTSSGDCFEVEPETFIQDPRAATPGAIVAARDEEGEPTGHWYVSSVIFPSVVNEYDEDGGFVRTVLPPGHGTPFGLAVDARGTLYVADLGITFDPTRIPENPDRLGLDTGEGEGSVLRVRFQDGVPLPPEVLKEGLDFPDGLGIVD